MNKVIISGRLTRDPEIRYSQGAEPLAITRISVAVSRRFKREGEQDVDFINCIAFGKTAEFIGKYFFKGKMIGITGAIRVNSWVDQNNQKRYSTEIYIEEVEFLESKQASDAAIANAVQKEEDNIQALPENDVTSSDDFYAIESGVDDENLPF